MKGDFTRFTFNPRKHYSSVRMQQGRVQLDADWNEEEDIRLHHERTINLDTFGACGAPIEHAGFGIKYVEEKDDFLISRGRYYIDGILCENECDVYYSDQPHFWPQESVKDLPEGYYLAYLDVWERSITSIEDPGIREVALGGPDTTTRTKIIWQVRLELLSRPVDDVDTEDIDLRDAAAKSCACFGQGQRAHMAARIKREADLNESRYPCIVSRKAGYSNLENSLYRVEIHDAGRVGTATFKWSRDNGCTVRAIDKIQGNTITISDPGRNCGQVFRPGQFVEITDENRELMGQIGVFARIKSVNDLTLSLEELDAELSEEAFPLHQRPKVCLWDSRPVPISQKGDWIKIEQIIDENTFKIANIGKDALKFFAPGEQVEITNEYLERQSCYISAGVKSLAESVEGIFLTLTDIEGNLKLTEQDFSLGNNPKVRHWDPEKEWIELENGIEISFEKEDEYQKGDYWLIQSRAATGQVEWPCDNKGEPEFVPRLGIEHHYAKIANLERDESGWKLHELRLLFPGLPNMVSMSYVGGDGQEGTLGSELPYPFQIRVSLGEIPISGAHVTFKIEKGSGELRLKSGAAGGSELIVDADENGIAKCYCLLNSEDILITAYLTRLMKESESLSQFSSPIICFRAVVYAAVNIGYRSPNECTELQGVSTVQEALDRLCNINTAAKIRYQPAENCKRLEGARTVKEALDRLCLTQLHGSCAITVGEGGQYDRLDKAIYELVEQGRSDIYICLLPGLNPLEGGLRLVRDRKDNLHLSIKGAGRGSQIELGRGKQILMEGLASLDLENLRISGDGADNSVLAINSIDCFCMENCFIKATGASGIALAIRDGEGESTLTNNQIDGLLCLYDGEEPTKLRPTELTFTHEDFGNLKKRVCQLLLRVRKGVLNLRENQIKRIVVGDGTAKRISEQLLKRDQGKPIEMSEIFQVIFLTNNIISDGPNQLLSANLFMNSNFFDRRSETGASHKGTARSPDTEWAIAGKAVYIGNIGDDMKLSSVSDISESTANLIEIIKY